MLNACSGDELTFDGLQEFIAYVDKVLQTQHDLIHQVFPVEIAGAAFVAFCRSLYSDVIAEYIAGLLDTAFRRSRELYFNTALESYAKVKHLTKGLEKLNIDEKDRDELLYGVYGALVEEFVIREVKDVRDLCDKEVRKWNKHVGFFSCNLCSYLLAF